MPAIFSANDLFLIIVPLLLLLLSIQKAIQVMELNVFEIVKSFYQLIKLHNAGMVWNPHEIEKFFSLNKLGPAEEDFVNHCTVQWMHHLSAIKMILNLHWKKLAEEKTSHSRMDVNVIEALLYLVIFEAESFPVEQYEKLIFEFSCYELFKLLWFLSDNLTQKDGIIFQSLIKIYDVSYIHDKIMEPLRRQRNFLLSMCKRMEPLIVKKKHKKIKKPLTVFNPFNLTKPKARSVPIPELFNNCPQTALAVPPTTYIQPQIFFRLQEKMIENKRKAKKLLEEIQSNQNHYQKTEKSERTLKRMAEILDEQEQQLQFSKWKAIEMPNLHKEICPVKKNITTVLREGAHIQKQFQDHLAQIKDYEGGAFAKFAFRQWHDDILRKELEEKVLRRETVHLKNRLCLEDAKTAKQKSVKAKHQKAQRVKKEKQQLLRELKKEEIEREHEIKQVIDKIAIGKQQVRENLQNVAKFKRQQAKALQADFEEKKMKAEEISQKEMNQKKALIEQIRTFELITSTRNADPKHTKRQSTETSAEIKEKLHQVRKWQQEVEAARRKTIEDQKKCKKEQLEEIEKITANFKLHHRSLKKQSKLAEKEILPKKILQENVDFQALQKKADSIKRRQKQAEKSHGNKEQELKIARQHLKDLALNSKNYRY